MFEVFRFKIGGADGDGFPMARCGPTASIADGGVGRDGGCLGMLDSGPRPRGAHRPRIRADADITGLEIPTGQPIVYELADDLSVVRRYDL